MKRNSRHVVFAACFLVVGLLATGLSLYRDYGVSWDEPVQRAYGETVYAYAFDGDDALLADRHRVYGPVFEVLLVSLERGLGLEDSRDVYFMRHLFTFLMFAAGIVFFFLLAARVLRDWRMGLMGALLFILTPRVFAHAFYNSKDIPFMAMFVICMYTLVAYLDRRSAWASVLHGACCALLVDMRVMGIFVPVITLGFFLGGLAAKKAEGPGRAKIALNFGLFCSAFVPLAILFWPTLWSNPFANFISAFDAMRKFSWGATVLFMGEEVRSTELPPHYTAVWIFITLPIMYLLLSATGLVAAALRLAGRSETLAVRRRDALLVLIWLIVPLAFLSFSGAVLYDTWRHSFFVYPAILMLVLIGFGWLLRISQLRISGVRGRVCALSLILLLAANVSGAVSFMIRSHPHQNVYFNSTVGGTKGAAGNYEMDYWGLSYRDLLESMLEKDSRAAIRVHSLNEPGYYNSFVLPPRERARITYADGVAGADYYITNYRWERMSLPAEAEFAGVKVDGVTLSAAYRVR